MDETRYLDRIGQLVEPGEQVRAHAGTEIGGGLKPPPPPDAAAPEVSGRATVSSVLLNLLTPLVTWDRGDRLVDLIGWGIAGRGAAGSAASRLRGAVDPARPDGQLRHTLLAVTDRRLLVCVTGPVKLLSKREDDERSLAETRIAWAAPRAEVTSARVGWHRLNPKRLRIDFTDGSWLAFTVPIAESGRPLRAVAAALTG
ncbi:hypothetical protein Q2K19_09520 [Micromonospora soli]|uniref:hypothetical protein n=1 Tax=Micromonospora sp. NBRC 110009 TaxID=3061627 RepID=UPI002670D464|nr:hypothetical protein [Micromonospora sp. NBRC 110009]WKU00687.1 hypothetical protein Q2K19_09520 [Micromonospora sp. NBRC 110009]